MTINTSPIPTSAQAAGKSSTLLAALASDAGGAKRPGQNFAQLLDSATPQPAKPRMQPLPERAPMPRVEVEPPPRQADVPRSTEPVPTAPDRAPSPASRSEQKAADAGAQEGRARDAASVAAKSAKSGNNAKAPAANSYAAGQPAQGEGGTSASAEPDELAAGAAPTGKRPAKATDASDDDNTGALTAILLAATPPDQAAPTSQPKQDAGMGTVATADTEAKPNTTAPAADPASLASLMPSVAQAVFGSAGTDAGAAIKAEAGAAADTGSTMQASDGALPLPGFEPSALLPQPGAAARAKPDLLDTGASAQALAAAGAQRGETAMLADSAQEPARLLAIDSKPQAGAAGFGQMLQAAGATGPVGGNAPQHAATAAVPVTVYTALHEPGFAPEMASRLTLLAGDGVQKAQLHLNPAEMGPVSVQIQLDGQQAQVEFHAQHAATREVLERSLPELAAALRDAGMTLSGGGVFQQPRDAQQDSQAQNQAAAQGTARAGQSGNGGGDKAGPGLAQQTGQRSQRGVLDMYA